MLKKAFLLLSLVVTIFAQAQNVPSPKSHFGFNIGDNYQLANYTQTEAYLQKLAAASNKMKLQSIGTTEEGRTQYMVIVSDPANLAKLSKYKSISQQMARAEGLTDTDAKQLANEGKAVVWIDGGLHANEVLGIHQWIETLYQILSRNDDETKRILKSTIILFVHANPDGQELQSDWYMRHSDTLKRNTANLPRLYQKYIGHDNNRDFYMTNMSESRNMSLQQYVEWMPQILYNHHQTGPAGTVVAGPPYRDPFNYVYDPLLITGIDQLGAVMSTRLNAENKPGYTMKSGSVYSTWWNGGLRTTAYYHNIVGLLTEMIGNPTPMKIPFVPSRLIPNSGTPFPIAPQKWYFRNSIDYSVSLNYAVLNYASRHKDELLMNIYTMGKNSINAGSKDYWTLSPNKVEMVNELMKSDQKDQRADTIALQYYEKVYKNPKLRDARGYIIPISQTTTATNFVNILIKSGIRVEKATAHLLEPFDGPFETIPYGEEQKHKGSFTKLTGAVGYTFSTKENASYILINDLLKDGIEVEKNSEYFYVAASDKSVSILENAAAKHGLKITGVQQKLNIGAVALKPSRIALWDVYGGSMPSGWTRWIFEQYHFPFTVVFAKELDAGNLKSKYDVILFVGGAIPAYRAEAGSNAMGGYEGREPSEKEIPEMYHAQLGRITAAKSIPALKEFAEAGGTIITVGSSANLAYHFKLPVRNALVEMVNGKERPLPGEKFYIPGSVMQVAVNNELTANWGMKSTADVYFSASPVFNLLPNATATGEVTPLAWYATDKTLRSGWAYGQSYLQQTVAAFEAKVGKGKLMVYGPEITFRGQTHSTYKMLFNQLYVQ
ncbi:MAG: M14 family metallopeptidase [Bacteroidetes bacterium]|nr:M14 family metallopeptidase [Bacteroidota bacterium]